MMLSGRDPDETKRRPFGVGRGFMSQPNDEGVVAVEFALVAPLFMLLIFGTMVFALYFATFVAVIHGASEGARASVAGLSDTERGTLATARVQYVFSGYAPLLNPAHVTIRTQAANAGLYKVTVTYPISDFQLGAFYNFIAGGAAGAPTTVGYSVIVANGGY